MNVPSPSPTPEGEAARAPTAGTGALSEADAPPSGGTSRASAPSPAPDAAPPPDAAPSIPATPTWVSRTWARFADRAHRVTLSTRMVALVVAALTIGLALSTVAATTQLRSYMVDELDARLLSVARSSEALTVPQLMQQLNQRGLTDDLVTTVQLGGVWQEPSPGSGGRWGSPVLPVVTSASAELAGEPFTVDGVATTTRHLGISATTQWRVVMLGLDLDGRFAGAIAIALPLAPVTAATTQLTKILLVVSVALVAAAAGLGFLAVRRSLRPLRQIEATARAIADGDLSSRIPEMPTTTEVGAVAQSLNVMLGRIQESFDARAASEARMRRFVSDASHELRTPLVSIRGYAELYRMGAVPPAETGTTMGRIESSAVQMGSLVEDLLALARLDEQRPLDLAPVDLAELVTDALADLHAMDPSRATEVRVVGPDGTERPAPADGPPSLLVLADEARMRQVLTNLVGNVVRHTPAGTPVEIALSVADGVAMAELRDHGPGIPVEHREAVFERFHRVDLSRNSASGGSGLGLAIVRSVVRAHGGDVTVVETPGGGATMRVSVPAAL